jgi:hypothetical protein
MPGMSTADEQLTGPTPSRTPVREPSRSALRISGAIRLGVAVVISGAVTAALIVAIWGPLHVKATVVGYPIYYNFNPFNFSRGYELTVVLFPLLTLGIFYGLTWLGPRLRLPTPPPRGRVRPLGPESVADEVSEPGDTSDVRRRLGAASHVVFVGAVLGLEVGIAADRLRLSILLTAVGYSVVVVAAAAAWSRVARSRLSFDLALANINAVATALTIAGLVLVSAHTELTVTAGNVRHSYPWCPPWVGLPLAFISAGAILVVLRRSASVRAAAIERWTVLVIAGSVAIFILAAYLPGDLGQLGLFEEGQQATEAMLVGHGWLPWREVFVAHGLLGDVAPIWAGWGVFGNSWWGGAAGFSLLLNPISAVSTYLLLCYLVRRRWPLIFIGGLIFLGTWFGAVVDPRYCLFPIVLLLLAALLRHPARWLAITLGALVVAQGIVSDEMVPYVPITLLVVAAYEWYWRQPGVPWKAAFRRTTWMTLTIVVGVVAFIAYMVARGAFGAVIYDTLTQLPGHTLVGGNPPLPIPGTPEPVFLFVTIAPMVAVLIAMAYAVIRLRLRRPFRVADWPVGASAIFVFFYYSKFLAVMDMGHAYQVFAVATPLMLYIIYRAVATVDDWIRSRPEISRTGWARWMPAYPVAIALLAYFLIAFWGPLSGRVKASPAAYRPVSPVPATVKRVGYSSDVDAPAIHDLGRILDAYLGPHGQVYDFTNEPGLFYYFLNRNPSNRWFAPDGLVQTPQLQNNLIGDLRRNPPKLLVFDDTDSKMYGLEADQGIPVASRLYLVSRWILRHYKPLLVSHNRVIYALPSVHPIPVARLNLEQRPVTTGVRFLGQSCLWGDSPTFLTGPAQPRSGAASAPVRVVGRSGPSVTLTGWAGDLASRRPAREVIATLDGRIVARAKPSIDRPDVVKTGLPSGLLRSGYQLSVPVSADAASGLRVFAVGADGSVAEIPIGSQAILSGATTIAGRSVTLQPKAIVGSVDTEVASNGYLKIAPPAGSSWADYSWLQVRSGRAGWVGGQSTLADVPAAPVTANFGHFIAFSTVPSSPSDYTIPVASCQQWPGYGSRPLYLTPPVGQAMPTVRLVR